MKQNKGFTLIELLAVIVILAIVALIATPIVLNIIESSGKSSAESSMNNIKHAAQIYYASKITASANPNGTTFTCTNGTCSNGTDTLDIDGKGPSSGTITINSDGIISFSNIIINGYSCVEINEKFICGDQVTSNGNSNGILTNYKIYGNSVQEVKYYFDSSTPTIKNAYLNADGSLAENTGWSYTDYIEVDGNSFLLKNIAGIAPAICAYDENKNYITGVAYNTGGIQTLANVEITSNTRIKYIRFSMHSSTNINNIELINISEIENVGELVTNTSDANYGKYIIPITVSDGTNTGTTNIYLDEPLRKVGDYADYIDFANQKVVRNVGTATFNGSEIWQYTTSPNNKTRVFTTNYREIFNKTNNILSNKYLKDTDTSYPEVNKISINSVGSVIIGVDGTKFVNVDDFKTWLAVNNVKVYAPLATPTEESISIPDVGIGNKDVTISVGTTIQPSRIEATYIK